MSAPRKIIHVDMDAFFASVEQRDHPSLRGQPVIVGGRPDSRGVVAACSYEARSFGVRSAMASSKAARLCPHAQFVRPRFDAYRTCSQQIHSVFRRYTSLIEPLSLDEAFLDVTQACQQHGSATETAQAIKRDIYQLTGLVASAGVSYNKFLAKIASDMDKPDGLFVIRPQHADAFIAQLPIRKFFGVGRVTEQKMNRLGIHTGADLRRWSESDLIQQFGKSGSYYHRIARGHDDRPVNPNRERKSIGSETTFAEDLLDLSDIQQKLQELAAEVWASTQTRQWLAATLTIKVKYHDFAQITRSQTQPNRFHSLTQVETSIQSLMNKTELGARPCRLLGVSLSRFSPLTPPNSALSGETLPLWDAMD